MKALVKAHPKPGLWAADVPVPECGSNDVLIKIKKTAICGTDLHIYNWDAWSQQTIQPPLIAGHEFFGEVACVGEQVTNFQPGDRVSGEGHLTCGMCRNCRRGKAHLCIDTTGIGVNTAGAFAEYLLLPASNVYPVPDAIADDTAALFDPFGNAAHTAFSFDLVGEDVLITGAGPIGIMAAGIARKIGARYIVISDVNEYRLGLAKKMGVTRCVNVAKESLHAVQQELGMREGFDVGMEMSGVPSAFIDMLDNMNHGGNVALLGIFADSLTLKTDPVIFKGLTVKGIYGREMFETWYKMINLLQCGLDLSPVITHRFPADEFEQAFHIMKTGQAGKIILDWQ